MFIGGQISLIVNVETLPAVIICQSAFIVIYMIMQLNIFGQLKYHMKTKHKYEYERTKTSLHALCFYA